MKLFEKGVFFLVAAMLVLGMGFNQVNAVEVTLGGSIDFQAYGRLSGGEGEDGFASIWEKEFYDTQMSVPHLHPTIKADISEQLSGDILFCLTDHHPTQVWIASIDYNPFVTEGFGDSLLNIKMGRFMVPFGRLNGVGSHPGDLKTITRPLIYVGHAQEDMELHGGPRPPIMTPYFDNGIQVYGSKWLRGEKDQLWYGAYIIGGMFYSKSKWDGLSRIDIDWEGYHAYKTGGVDTNDNKAFGGRVTYSYGDSLTVGASFQMGKYDPKNRLAYSMLGIDVRYEFEFGNLQFEFASNPVEWINPSGAETTPDEMYSLGTKEEYTKAGWYLQFDMPFKEKFEFVANYSILTGSREEPINTHTYDGQSQITVGVNYLPDKAVRYKLEYQMIMLAGSYNDTPANVAKYGDSFDSMSRINLAATMVF